MNTITLKQCMLQRTLLLNLKELKLVLENLHEFTEHNSSITLSILDRIGVVESSSEDDLREGEKLYYLICKHLKGLAEDIIQH